MPNKFIKNLTDEDYQKLIENYQTNDNFRIRHRSQAILLSFQQHSVDEIARMCQVHRTTVCRWIDWWNEGGADSLADSPKPGRMPILSLEEQDQAVAIALQNPRFPHRQLGAILRETGKEISSWTLKRLLKKKIICGSESS